MSNAIIVKITEKNSKPPIWYSVKISEEMTFAQFADVAANLLAAAGYTTENESKCLSGKTELDSAATLKSYFADETWFTYSNGANFRVDLTGSEEAQGTCAPTLVKRSKAAIEAMADESALQAALAGDAAQTSADQASAAEADAMAAVKAATAAVAAIAETEDEKSANVQATMTAVEEALRSTWLRECLEVVPLFYGAIPMDTFHLIVCKENEMSMEDMERQIRALPEEMNPCVIVGNKLIAKDFFEDKLYEKLELQQSGKSFYIPTKQEIVEMSAFGYPATDAAWRNIYNFLAREFELDAEEGTGLLSGIWYTLSLGGLPTDVMNMFNDRELAFSSQAAAKQFVTLLMNIVGNMRMLVNRGFSPNELAVQSNRQAFGGKKIYPNEKCPCGSGKKYKHCHGRK